MYAIATTCRPGRLAPGIEANLVRENYPAWNGDLHNNINLQGDFMAQYTANRLDLGEPLYRLLRDVLPRCRRDTAAYFMMRGARYPISMGPDGAETAPGVLLSTWIGAGGWLAAHLWWHYRYSGDRAFLRRQAYPMLEECAQFYEDYLQRDDAGRLYLFPTIHMEVAISTPAGVGKNSAWDLPVVIRTFQMALAAARELGVDKTAQSRWAQLLTDLPTVPHNADGVWLEFEGTGGPWHLWDFARFMAIYPMELVSRDHGPAALREQARRTCEEYAQYRSAGPMTEKDCIAHLFGGDVPASHAKDVMAVSHFGIPLGVSLLRMGLVERGVQVAEAACARTSPTAMGPADAGYFSNDCHFMPIFLNEMLLQSHADFIRVFPAVPATPAPVRFHSLRAQGAFLVSAERRDGRVLYVIVQSLRGNLLRLANPFTNEADQGVQVKIYRADRGTDLSSVAAQRRLLPLWDRVCLPEQIIDLPTRAGATYIISKEIPWFSTIPLAAVAPNAAGGLTQA